MKKDNKRSRQPRIVELGPESFKDNSALNMPKSGSKRSITITQSVVVRVPVDRCFKVIDRQLEETPYWDPIIKWVNPISSKHVRVGSMSRVTFDFRGVIEEAVAMIRSYRLNSTILWTSTHSSQLQEEWHLQSEPHGTLITVTLSYNTAGWALARLVEKVMVKNKVEKDVSEMLARLKAAIENSRDE